MHAHTCTLGIDPGATGAIALLCAGVVRVYDVPATAVKRGRTVRQRINGEALHRLMVRLSLFEPQCTLIEDVWGLPGQSAPAAHAFGVSCGMLAQACVGAGLSPRFVAAPTWKQALRLPADKGASLAKARALWPDVSYFKRAGDHNRAEAALLAHYAAHYAAQHILKADAPKVGASSVIAAPRG